MALPSVNVAAPNLQQSVGRYQQMAAQGMDLAQGHLGRVSQFGQNTDATAAQQQAQAAAQNQPDYGAVASWGNDGTPRLNAQRAQEVMGHGFGSNVPLSLIATESSGNWGADNKRGYHGILQFGQGRFQDAVRAGVIPQGMTLQQFGSNTPEGRGAQVSAANWHFTDIDNAIRRRGFDQLVGQSLNGVPVTWNGMRAAAHLGGIGGMSKFLSSGGQYNPADAFGTSLAKYFRQHAA